jgi:cholest-4-en-3-one 26-monooxygenase
MRWRRWRQAPVRGSACGGDFWAATRHQDVAYLSRHPEVFSSARRTVNFREFPDRVVERLRLMMLNTDPPQHG